VTRRFAAAALLAASLVGACGSASPTPQIIYVTVTPAPSTTSSAPSPSTTTTPSPAPTVAPTATPLPTATPVPTPTPTPIPVARLVFGSLHYAGSACFRTDVTDSAGHTFSGITETLSFTVANKGKARSKMLWVKVDGSGSWALSNMMLFGSSANSLGPEKSWGLGSDLSTYGRAIKPGEKVTWKIRLFFDVASRVDFTVSVIEGPGAGDWSTRP
jgi:hypothetical protein